MIENEDRRGRRAHLEDWRGPQSKTRRLLDSSGSNWTPSTLASNSRRSRGTATNVIEVHKKLPGSLQLSYEKAKQSSSKYEEAKATQGTRRTDPGECGFSGRKKSVISGNLRVLPKPVPLSGPKSSLKPRESDVVGVHRFPLRAPRDANDRSGDKPRTQRPSPYISNAFRDRNRGASGPRSSSKVPNRRNPSNYNSSQTTQRSIASYDVEVSRVHFPRKPKLSFESGGTKHTTAALKTTVHKEYTDNQHDVQQQQQHKPKTCTDLVPRRIKNNRYDDKKKKVQEEEMMIHAFPDDPIRQRSPRVRSRSPITRLLITSNEDLPWNKKKGTRRGESSLARLKFTCDPRILATEHLVNKFYPFTSTAPTDAPPVEMRVDFDSPHRKSPMRMGEIIKSVERKLRAVQKMEPLLGSEPITSRKKAVLGKTRAKYSDWRDPILTPNEEVRGTNKNIIYKGQN